ncbi:MAG: hypothetical protein ACOCUN_02700 [Jiangellaceae bacterium]
MTTSPQEHARLRAALHELTGALEVHLEAVLRRASAGDRAVQDAYARLRESANRYDDLLFELTGEVTPWEFPEEPDRDVEYESPQPPPGVVAMLVRRDYSLADPTRLLAAGRQAYGDLYPADPPEAAHADVSHPGRALYQMLHAYGVDGLEQRAADAGLAPQGGTVWVQESAGERASGESGNPFGLVDEQRLIYRVDERPPDG